MSTSQNSYRIALALRDLAECIGDTTPEDILSWLVGTEISNEDARHVTEKLAEYRSFLGEG